MPQLLYRSPGFRAGGDRRFLGSNPEGDIVTYDDNLLQDPGVLARPAAAVVGGVRLRLSLRKRHYG